MGCTASKLDNEDTVRRCKERRRLMKEAVFSRLHLAAAHSDYCRSLRLTGTALSVFASGEPLSVSDQTPPAVLLRNPSSLSSSSANHFPPRVPPKKTSPPGHAAAASAAAYRREYSHLGNDNEVPVPRSISRSTSLAPSESSRSNVSRSASFAPPPRERRRAPPPKLPHILSQSSLGSESNIFNNDNFAPSATYASTPSQASSVWNWENFYPPSPPSSEYFEQRKFATERQEFVNQQHEFANEHRDFSTNSQKSRHFADEDRDFSTSSQKSHRFANEDRGFSSNSQKSRHFADEDRDFSTSSQKSPRFANEDRDFSTNSHKSHHFADEHRDFSTNSLKSRQFANEHRDFSTNSQKSHHLIDDDEDDGDEGEETREEVQCSEWGDHYSTTSSSSLSDDGASRSEVGSRSNFSQSGASIVGQHQQASQQQAKKKYQPVMSDKSEEEEAEEEQASGYSAVSYGADMKMVVRHKDFAEIVAAIKENFDLAAEAGEKVSEMLDIGRAQLDRSFSQLKKTVYHSSGVFSNLSSSWTSKPPLSVKYRLDASTLDEPGGPKSLCSTLERLLAWEKKLYDEVKAREGVKIELDKKLSTLQSQEYKGEDEAKVDKTKATINRLRSLVVVTSQAVTTTSTAIIGLRDSDLIPQLGELCHGFMYMWRSMNQYHEIQSQIVQQVQGLENRASKSDSTSDLHRQATRDLESAVSAWHSSFCRLVKFQRDFIRSLHGWFKLTLLPVNNDKDITPGNNRGASDAFSFCDEWKLALDRLPDTVASEAINSFVNVVHVIYVKQSEELKIKKRTEMVCKELEKKASNLRNIEKKYYHSYSMVGIGLPDTGPNNNYALDARDPLAEKKSELAACQRKVEDEMFRHSKAVEVTRAMTQNNLQTGLPGVFQAMSSFSALCVEALEAACTRSYAIK